ncbi:MAG: hypothetical protein WC323_02240 [Patescibacteria group bacterium]|jgi:ABC-type transporter Mla MlaB component
MIEKLTIIDSAKNLEQLAQKAIEVLKERQREAQVNREKGDKYKPEFLDIDVENLENNQRELALYARLDEAKAKKVDSSSYQSLLKEVEDLQKNNHDLEGHAKDKKLDTLFSLMREDLSTIYLHVLQNEQKEEPPKEKAKKM